MDTQVEAEAARVCAKLPAERLLNQHQRRIVEMLVEHMRSLPQLAAGEKAFGKKEYQRINSILTHLFCAKYPTWDKLTPDGRYDVDEIPNGEGKVFCRLLNNCGGRAPEETVQTADGE